MRRTTAPLVIALMILSAPARAQTEPTSAAPGLKPSELAGGYEIVAGEKFGAPEPAERIQGSTVRFTKDRVVVMDKESREVYGAAYSLEPAEAAAGEAASGATGSKIKMTSKLAASQEEEQVALGMIDKDGDKVRLIYALPGGEAPREFKTKAGQLMFVLKRRAD